MDQYFKTLSVRFVRRARSKATLSIRLLVFLLGILPGLPAFCQQPNKVQQMVNSIKETFSNEDENYITDGQRTVWVKSYKKWTPQDLGIMKKEAPGILNFLALAVQHNRGDVLEQLLPDYYLTHGGIKAFAGDVMHEQARTPAKGQRQSQ